jgi:hypothetical protein
MKRPRWTRAVRATDDLGKLVADAWHVRGVSADADDRSIRYGDAKLLAAEQERDARKQAMRREFHARFIDGPHLTIPMAHGSFEFDPNASQPFESFGTVYPTMTMRADWGSLVVRHGGALIASDWVSLVVPATPGDDYTLTLNDGWSIVPASRQGDVTLKRK